MVQGRGRGLTFIVEEIRLKPCFKITSLLAVQLYTLGRPLSREVLFRFLLEVAVTNWATQ